MTGNTLLFAWRDASPNESEKQDHYGVSRTFLQVSTFFSLTNISATSRYGENVTPFDFFRPAQHIHTSTLVLVVPSIWYPLCMKKYAFDYLTKESCYTFHSGRVYAIAHSIPTSLTLAKEQAKVSKS